MGGKISLGKVAHFKWLKCGDVMRATIGVWSLTLLEVILHIVPASLLVRMFTAAIIMHRTRVICSVAY